MSHDWSDQVTVLDDLLYAVLSDKLTFPAAESITFQLGHRPCCGPELCSRKHMAAIYGQTSSGSVGNCRTYTYEPKWKWKNQ